jgi:hypothetical protein
MARSRGWPPDRISRGTSAGLIYAGARKLARKAAPLPGGNVPAFWRLRKNEQPQAGSVLAGKRSQ